MVQVTPQAVQHLTQVRDHRGLSKGAGARFVANGSGVSFTFSSKPEPGDSVIDGADLSIYVAPEAARRLVGSTIDLTSEAGKKSLVLVRKKARAAQS